MCVGEDRYGIWSDVEILGVVQRFRWIFPGEFQMGSPEDEKERFESEVQHTVKLTKGYWLADTACTQELWQTVTGDNPSNFNGYQKPVEDVRWNECAAFIKYINEENSGLNLSFPTEAQWECACRAGTKTPFSFGDSTTPHQENYNGDQPYAGGEKGIYRKETVDVKSLPANLWGLYEMHGNVWEWCADKYGDYPAGRLVDPEGPNEGDARVLRGGSWMSNGKRCRSASRYMFRPGSHDYFIGFRLARYPVGRNQEK